MWDEEGRMWINENDVEKMNEVYKLYDQFNKQDNITFVGVSAGEEPI